MMESLSLEGKKIKDIRNLFRLEKETKAIKDIMPEDIKMTLSMKKEKIIVNQYD